MTYAEAAPIYQSQGWHPIPVKGKTPVPAGCTGQAGTVTPDKIAAWLTSPEWGNANTAIRHEGTIAIDVDDDDHGADKRGAQQLAALEAVLGTLPATFTSTARGQHSRTRQHIYQVPEGMRFKQAIGDSIEIIQHRHRYTVAADSVHPDNCQPYEWFDPEDQPCGVPAVDDVEWLPDEWLTFLAEDDDPTEATIYDGDARGWLAKFGGGQPDVDLEQSISRWNGRGHETMVRFQAQIIGRSRGAEALLTQLKAKWDAAPHATAEPAAFTTGLEGAIRKYGAAAAETQQRLDAFWGARDELATIWRNSRRVMLSPWSLLGTALARAAHTIPYDVMFRSAIGASPINIAIIRVGGSGGGKTAAERAMNDMLRLHDGFGVYRFEAIEAGSGEAISNQYAHVLTKDDETSGTKAGELAWHRSDHACYFTFDEVGRLVKVGGRDGSTMFEYIKTGWSGAALGRRLVNGGVQLPADTYRMTVIMNGQPERCAPLLTEDEIFGGFPGRLLWFSTQDAELAKADRDRTPIEVVDVKSQAWLSREIRALDIMDEAFEDDRRASLTGVRDPMEGHRLFTQAKVAVALMALAGREQLNEDDWDMADVVMEHSTATREWVRERIRAEADEQNARLGRRDGTRQAITEDIKATRAIERVALLLAKYRDAGVPETGWSQKLKSSDRHLIDDAKVLMSGGEA